MKLIKFQIKNYRSIIDSGIVELSQLDNVTVLAGQNESGKSSILSALRDYEKGKFEDDSIPYSTEANPIQSVSCTYKIEEKDNWPTYLEKELVRHKKLEITEGEHVLDLDKLSKITEFTLSRNRDKEGIKIILDKNTFSIFNASVLDKPVPTITDGTPSDTDPVITTTVKEKYFVLNEDNTTDIAEIFFKLTPSIVFFDDFCDLLPDKIFLSDLKTEKSDVQGYKAVKNLEQILDIDLVAKEEEMDAIRRTKEETENTKLSVDFQEDWGQRIHGENKVNVKYNFEKRNGVAEEGSYVNFFVETKAGQYLSPKKRSKGLIWFLSLWLELKALDNNYNNLVLLLDEPDQHLHVKAQDDILKLINKLSKDNTEKNKNGDQIIFATHSPYLIEVENLNRVKLIINSERDGTRAEDVTSSKIDSEYKKDALQPIANAIGLSVGGFSTLGERNILLEGISDFYYFSAMKKILNKTGNYYFVPGVGARKVNNLISLSIGYGLDWIVILDDDPENGGKDSKTKFDEIRDYIFDRDDDKTSEKVHILKDIVGIENMFTKDDLKLVDPNIGNSNNLSKAVGQNRKVLFSKLFYEKVKSDEIKEDALSTRAKENFTKAFAFIEKIFGNN